MGRGIERRGALQVIGAALATPWIGCGGNGSNGASAVPGSDASSEAAMSGGWATGGTAAMTGKAGYPNPFAGGMASGCTATGALTGGPCWDSMSAVIQDISYGQDGLPMRMYFQVLDVTCLPIAGATVDVWHVAPTGKYSGDDVANENVPFCTAADPTYESHLYFRGKQTTDANGVAFFDTCFPGWYPGRTVHVHFTITSGSKSFTSQYVFDDALDDEIIDTQPVYGTRGKRDTTNVTDSVVTAADYQQFLFQTEKLADGTLLAWKAIVLSA
jgi:protocatechuate 3,4-dioxygenase beta subunit